MNRRKQSERRDVPRPVSATLGARARPKVLVAQAGRSGERSLMSIEMQSGAAVENGWLEFRPSLIHGMGAFARIPIARETRLIEYVGQKIDKAESLRRCEANNEYIFTLSDTLDLDGNVEWNPARLINHSCSPNCDAELDGERIWIVANRDIPAGVEITFNYGFDLVDYTEYPCRCGSPECVGYMVDAQFFEHVRRRQPTDPG